jgi:putative ABC transport system permease protein
MTQFGGLMGTMIQDLKYGLRMLAKNPGFTAVAVLTLAVGIAVNTAIFSVYNAAVLRPFQAADPNRLVNVFRTTLEDRYGWEFQLFGLRLLS